MTSMTNAQAALQAAATMYTGTDTHPDTVSGAAGVYKRWLDKQDREDKQKWVRPAAPETPKQAGAPLPGPRPQAKYPPTLAEFEAQFLPSSKGHPDRRNDDLFTGPGYEAHPGHDHEDCCK